MKKGSKEYQQFIAAELRKLDAMTPAELSEHIDNTFNKVAKKRNFAIAVCAGIPAVFATVFLFAMFSLIN